MHTCNHGISLDIIFVTKPLISATHKPFTMHKANPHKVILHRSHHGSHSHCTALDINTIFQSTAHIFAVNSLAPAYSMSSIP